MKKGWVKVIVDVIAILVCIKLALVLTGIFAWLIRLAAIGLVAYTLYSLYRDRTR